MRTKARSRGFLGGLWRERGAFSILALAILLANLVHPLAEAHAANGPNAWVICSSYGAVHDPSAPVAPGAADDCPMCIAGHGSCALPALPANSAILALDDVRANRLVPSNALPQAPAPAPLLPAIRAPPALS